MGTTRGACLRFVTCGFGFKQAKCCERSRRNNPVAMVRIHLDGEVEDPEAAPGRSLEPRYSPAHLSSSYDSESKLCNSVEMDTIRRHRTHALLLNGGGMDLWPHAQISSESQPTYDVGLLDPPVSATEHFASLLLHLNSPDILAIKDGPRASVPSPGPPSPPRTLPRPANGLRTSVSMSVLDVMQPPSLHFPPLTPETRTSSPTVQSLSPLRSPPSRELGSTRRPFTGHRAHSAASWADLFPAL